MYRKKEQIDREIDKLMKELNKIALFDDVISGDEQAIIDKIADQMKNMQEQIVQVLESELHDEEFNDLLMDCLNDTIVNVEKVAMLDGIITEDEKKLLGVLKEFVNRGGALSE